MSNPSVPEWRAFQDFEREGWQRVPVRYDDAFAGLTTQAAEPILDAAGVGKGTQVLDLATGPGYVAAAAAARGAHVVGVDFSAAMVAHAKWRHPGIDFRVGDAEDIAFDDCRFDAVVMNFGLLHLARPERALREAHRVLRPAARFAFTVWAPPAEAVGFGIVLRAIETHGRPNVALPPGPPFFRFSEPEEILRTLLDAGFTAPSIKRIPQGWRLPNPDALFENLRRGTVRTAGLIGAQLPEAQAAIRRAVREQVESYRMHDAVVLPMPAILASATKA